MHGRVPRNRVNLGQDTILQLETIQIDLRYECPHRNVDLELWGNRWMQLAQVTYQPFVHPELTAATRMQPGMRSALWKAPDLPLLAFGSPDAESSEHKS